MKIDEKIKAKFAEKARGFVSAADLAMWLLENGAVSLTALRNGAIREDYAMLKANGATMLDAERHIADDYCVSPETVHKVLFDRTNYPIKRVFND